MKPRFEGIIAVLPGFEDITVLPVPRIVISGKSKAPFLLVDHRAELETTNLAAAVGRTKI